MHYYLSSSPRSSPTPAVSWLQLSACELQLSHVVQALVAGLAGEGKRLGQLAISTAPLSFHLIFLPDFLPAALDAATAGAGSCGRQVQCCYTPPLFSKTALAPCASSSGALSPVLSSSSVRAHAAGSLWLSVPFRCAPKQSVAKGGWAAT